MGRVLELGGGAGGFTQWLIARGDCLKVDTLCMEREGHGRHLIDELKISGSSKNKVFFGDVHDFEPVGWYETFVSDIGEVHADPDKQLSYSRSKRDNFQRILVGYSKPKILCFSFCINNPALRKAKG